MLIGIQAFIVPFEMACDVSASMTINSPASSVRCVDDNVDADSDDDFKISLTESYLHCVVHTRPHTHEPHTARKPDLLLPPSLERYACQNGIKRTAFSHTSNDRALKVTSTDPTLSIAAPIHTASPDHRITLTTCSSKSTKSSKFPYIHPYQRPRTDPPSLSFPSTSRAAMHAARLWASHRFNHLDLTVAPDFLSEKASNAYEAAIQMELCILWKNALSKHLLRLEQQHAVVTFSKEFRAMEGLVRELRRRVVGICSVEVGRGKGRNVDGGGKGGMKQKQKQKQQVGGGEQAAQQNPKPQPHPQQRGSEQHQRVPVPSSGPFERSKEPNRGFGQNTKVIPFQKEGAAPSQKLSETLKRKKPVEFIDLEAKQDVVPQTKKRFIEVVDLEAKQDVVPQSKKRAVELVELEEEEDGASRAKKAKTDV